MLQSLQKIYVLFAEKFKAKTNTNIFLFEKYTCLWFIFCK